MNLSDALLETEDSQLLVQVLKESGWSRGRLVDGPALQKNLVVRWLDGEYQYATSSSTSVLKSFLGLKFGVQYSKKENWFVPIDFSLDYIISSHDFHSWLFYQDQLKDYLYPIAFQEGRGVELTIVSGISGKFYGICGISGDYFFLGTDIFHALNLLLTGKQLLKIDTNDSQADFIDLVLKAVRQH